ncbi:MAG: hypothetical protein ACHQJ6_08420 [Candidatus Berkiellales bacterium]
MQSQSSVKDSRLKLTIKKVGKGGKTNTEDDIAIQLDRYLGDTRFVAVKMEPGTLTRNTAGRLTRLLRINNGISRQIQRELGERENKLDRGPILGLWSYSLKLLFLGKRKRFTKADPHQLITTLDVSGNKVDDAIAGELSAALDEAHDRLVPTSINLSNCEMGETQFKIIFSPPRFEAYSSFPSFEKIDLSHNKIDDKAIDHLKFLLDPVAPAGEKAFRLSKLNLAHNQLTDEGAKKLIEILENDVYLTQLDLTGNKISPRLLTKIQQHLQDNQEIAELRKCIKKNEKGIIKLDLSFVNIITDEEKIRRVPLLCKMIRTMRIDKVDLPNPLLPQGLGVQLEKALLDSMHVKAMRHIYNEDAFPEIKRLPKFNRLIASIKDSEKAFWHVIRGGLIGFIAVTALGLHLTILILTLWMVFRMSFKPTSYSFAKKMNELKKPSAWTEEEQYNAKVGRDCKTSLFAMFRPAAWTPAAYLAYNTDPKGKKILSIDIPEHQEKLGKAVQP